MIKRVGRAVLKKAKTNPQLKHQVMQPGPGIPKAGRNYHLGPSKLAKLQLGAEMLGAIQAAEGFAFPFLRRRRAQGWEVYGSRVR